MTAYDEPVTPGSAIFPVDPTGVGSPELARLTNQLYVTQGSFVNVSWLTNDDLFSEGSMETALSDVAGACLAYNALYDKIVNSVEIPDTIDFPLSIAGVGSDIDTVLALNYIYSLI